MCHLAQGKLINNSDSGNSIKWRLRVHVFLFRNIVLILNFHLFSLVKYFSSINLLRVILSIRSEICLLHLLQIYRLFRILLKPSRPFD